MHNALCIMNYYCGGGDLHRFFAERTRENAARLLPEEARHALTVLRLREGDTVQVILEESLFDARILSIQDGVTAKLLSALPNPEPSVRVWLVQGLPKADKMDWIVQKCTEAGVYAVAPAEMPRCVVRLSGKDGAKKAERWQRIAAEAAKQSGRAHVPEVFAPGSLENALDRAPQGALLLVPWEEERSLPLRKAVAEHPEAKDIILVIGPEGGMGEEEIAFLKARGALPVTMGPRIFRTETAAVAAVILTLSNIGAYD